MQDEIKLTWWTTASIAIEYCGESLLFDPFIPLPHSKTAISADDYRDYRNILITHGHIDHISSLKEFVSRQCRIFSTQTPRSTLTNYFGVDQNIINIIRPTDKLTFGKIEVEVFVSRHIKFDTRLVLSTLINYRMLKFCGNLRKITKLNKICVENSETVSFSIKCGSKSIMLFGSIDYDKSITYPHADILIVPFQGTSYLVKKTLELIELTKPKVVIFDHFDDSFPPISKNIPVKCYINKLASLTSNIEFIIPQSKQNILL